MRHFLALLIVCAGVLASSCTSQTEVTVRNGFDVPVRYELAYVIETFGESTTVKPDVPARGPVQPGDTHVERLLFSGPESAPRALSFTVFDESGRELSSFTVPWADIKRADYEVTLE